MKILKKRRKGFTLVELVIVIAIVIILSVVSVPIYKGYTKQAMMTEVYALFGTILSAQKAYYSRYGTFLYNRHGSAGGDDVWTSNEEVLGIDGRGNKYFTAFQVGNCNGNPRNIETHFYAAAIKPDNLIEKEGKSVIRLWYYLSTGSRLDDNEDR